MDPGDIEILPLDPTDDRVADYLRLLQHPLNTSHFPAVPELLQPFRDQLAAPGVHPHMGLDHGRAVAFATIRDAQPQQHDHWLEQLVVANEFQTPQPKYDDDTTKRDRGPHIGHRFVEQLLRWAFTTPTEDGRERTKLDAAV